MERKRRERGERRVLWEAGAAGRGGGKADGLAAPRLSPAPEVWDLLPT